jgi:4-amino-4-deoxy-L-arabinose transferase-like glycosyltransferase
MRAAGARDERFGAFERRLAAVAAGALGVRVAAALGARDHLVQGDAMVFHQVAQHLADGDGFMQAFRAQPTAEHPPGWEVVLAAADLLGGNGYLSHRLLGAAIGTVTVVLIGLLGRRVTDGATGLGAAAIAAVYPMLWAADVSLMSETLYGALLVTALLAATTVRDGGAARGALLGALLGLAALTRGEAILLVPLLLVPLTWRNRRAMAAGVAAFALVLAPWTIRNLTTFQEPVLVSGNANGIWIGANCPDTYHGELIGYWRFQCYLPERPGEDESQYYARQRDAALEYAWDHRERWPAVIPARVLRLLDAWDVEQSQFINAQEGRGSRATRWGIRMWWLLAPLAAAGALLVRRERWVLLAPVALVLAVGIATYGTTRFRYAAEPSVCVLAAVAPVALRRTRITQFQLATSRRPGTRVMNASRGQ